MESIESEVLLSTGLSADTRAHHPQQIHVVAAVICREGNYLIAQRAAEKRHGNMWEFPVGKIDPGESSERAIQRELREELGTEVISTSEPLFTIADLGSHFVIAFHLTVIEGEPRAIEHEALAWVSRDELVNYHLAPCDKAFATFLNQTPDVDGAFLTERSDDQT